MKHSRTILAALAGCAGMAAALPGLAAAPAPGPRSPAAPAVAAPGTQIVSKPGLAVFVLQRGPTSANGALIQNVVLRIETGDDSALLYGFRSSRLLLDVDCQQGRDRIRQREVFQEPNLGGPAIQRSVPDGWALHSAGSYLADSIAALCRRPAVAQARPAASTRPVAVAPTAAKPALPAPAHATAAPALAAPPRPAPAPAAATARPQPLRPPPAMLRPPVAASPAAATARPAAQPARPPAAKPAVAASRPALAAPAAPAAPASGAVVQIAAADSRELAEKALAGVQPKLGPGLRGAIATAEVNGRTYHRVTVSGFASKSDAAAFCRRVGQCFIRP